MSTEPSRRVTFERLLPSHVAAGAGDAPWRPKKAPAPRGLWGALDGLASAPGGPPAPGAVSSPSLTPSPARLLPGQSLDSMGRTLAPGSRLSHWEPLCSRILPPLSSPNRGSAAIPPRRPQAAPPHQTWWSPHSSCHSRETGAPGTRRPRHRWVRAAAPCLAPGRHVSGATAAAAGSWSCSSRKAAGVRAFPTWPPVSPEGFQGPAG